MTRHLFALAAASLLSLEASAGYIQYDFNGPVQGSFVQHDTDGSIADYYFHMPVALPGLPEPFTLNFMPHQGGYFGTDHIAYATTHFLDDGPTNFSVYREFEFYQKTFIDIDFAPAPGGKFAYKIEYVTDVFTDDIWRSASGTVKGTAQLVKVDPEEAAYLDLRGGYGWGLWPIVPEYIGPATPHNPVPEPASWALMAAGALGALTVARRRKA